MFAMDNQIARMEEMKVIVVEHQIWMDFRRKKIKDWMLNISADGLIYQKSRVLLNVLRQKTLPVVHSTTIKTNDFAHYLRTTLGPPECWSMMIMIKYEIILKEVKQRSFATQIVRMGNV